jgi:hypothetical protein
LVAISPFTRRRHELCTSNQAKSIGPSASRSQGRPADSFDRLCLDARTIRSHHEDPGSRRRCACRPETTPACAPEHSSGDSHPTVRAHEAGIGVVELTVPDLPIKDEGDERRFTGCIDGILKSWVAPIDTAGQGTRSMATSASLAEERVLDPRGRWHPPGDRGELVACLTPRRRGRDAGHPGLHTDRAMRLLQPDRDAGFNRVGSRSRAQVVRCGRCLGTS